MKLITDKGVRETDLKETCEIKEIYRFLRQLDDAPEKVLFIVHQRQTTELTLFDMLLSNSGAATMVKTPNRIAVYPANVMKRRSSGLCASA